MKNLLVFQDAGPDSAPRLDFAAALAEALDAHLTAVAMAVEPAFVVAGGSPAAAEFWMQQLQAARRQAADQASAAQDRLLAAGLAGDARSASLPMAGVSKTAALHARYADLAIVGDRPLDDLTRLREEVLDGVLFDSGRPALVAPPSADANKLLRRAMIAWDGGPSAARAVGDALPLLRSAEEIAVVVVAPEVGTDAHGEEPGGDIALYLARHGLSVDLHQIPKSGKTIAEALTSKARDWDAGVLVMGGYGHSQFRERFFGGVTRDLLRAAETPLFMSH